MHPTGPHLGPDVYRHEFQNESDINVKRTTSCGISSAGVMGRCFTGRLQQQTARAMPDKIAVVDNHGQRTTPIARSYAASCLANWILAKGIESGDRIAFQLPGWCGYRYLSCLLKISAVSVPLLPSWREAELVWVLNKCQAKMFFAPTLFKQPRQAFYSCKSTSTTTTNCRRGQTGSRHLFPLLSQIIADNIPLTTAITTRR